MRRFLFVLLLAAPVVQSQTPISNSGSDFASTLNFETQHTGTTPRGCSGSPPNTFFVDGNTVHSGRWAVRLERNSASAQDVTSIRKVLPADFTGKTIEWRGFLRTEDVSKFTGLWLREDGDKGGLALDNMQSQQ